MDSFIYDMVKKNQKTLSAKEQFAIAVAIRSSCDKILEFCYLHPQARQIICTTLARTVNRSKLGRDYNTHVLGYNKAIHDRITEAYSNLIIAPTYIDGATILRKANLHPRVVLNDEVMEVINASATWQAVRVQEELAALTSNREALVNCVLEAAAEIAIAKHKSLNSEIIEESDLFQEALKAAHEGTLLYNYDSKAKWSSFAYQRMHDSLFKFIADKSRVVAVPRSLIERFGLIAKAVKQTQSIDTLTLMEYANQFVGNGLDYTEKEVETILFNMQSTISLDWDVDEDGEQNQSNSLLEMISLDNRSDEDITSIFLKKNVASILKRKLSPLEYAVTDMMYGLTDEPKDLNETYERINILFPTKKLSRNRIKRIAERVLMKLKKSSILKEVWQEV